MRSKTLMYAKDPPACAEAEIGVAWFDFDFALRDYLARLKLRKEQRGDRPSPSDADYEVNKITPRKPCSEAERIELYRRAWGPSWRPTPGVEAAVGKNERGELIKQHMIVVETIAGTLLRGGQNTAIQKHDLLQVGYAE